MIFLPFIMLFVPFWSELFWVWPVLGVVVQVTDWDYNNSSLGNGHSIYFYILLAGSLNPPTNGIDPKGFIQCHVKIFQLHQHIIRERSL